jgi:chromosomal replication initiator protein
MGKKTARLSPYVFPGLKLTQKEREGLKNSQRSLRYKISKDEILEIIAEECSIKVSDIASKTRKTEVVNGRFIFCGVMKEYFGYSLKKIGEFVGGRDHTTIIHSIKEYKNRYQNEEHYRHMVNNIYNKIGLTK